MRERPILFSGPMVQALLAGKKTVTRRVVKLPVRRGEWESSVIGGAGQRLATGAPVPEHACIWNTTTGEVLTCPYGQPGDRLWVRETWSPDHRDVYPCYEFVYAADGTVRDTDRREHITACTEANRERGVGHSECLACVRFRWRPSIHMPRRASRLVLEVVAVRCERLHDITEEDARAEGVEQHPEPFTYGWRNYESEPSFESVAYHPTARESFASLWRSINGAESWDVNPWVWAVTFRRVEASRP